VGWIIVSRTLFVVRTVWGIFYQPIVRYEGVELQKGRPSCSCCMKVDIVDSLTEGCHELFLLSV
jgi:hypothetical protein